MFLEAGAKIKYVQKPEIKEEKKAKPVYPVNTSSRDIHITTANFQYSWRGPVERFRKFGLTMLEKTYWERFLDVVEPHLPEYLHWNEICVS